MLEIWQRGQNDPQKMSDFVLFSRIAETIVWCDKLLSQPETPSSLRTENIKPRQLHDGCDHAVCEVGSSRHWLIEPGTTNDQLNFPNLGGGKLLTYFPDADLCDGAAEVESDDFSDSFNCPPWDTWIAFFDDATGNDSYSRYLLAYVPSQLIALADAGIEVNPEECIRWLDTTDAKLKSRLLTELKT